MMVGVAGALLLTPGYFTDLIGMLLLIPPVRGLIYAFLRARMTAVAQSGMSGTWRSAQQTRTIDLDDEDWRRR